MRICYTSDILLKHWEAVVGDKELLSEEYDNIGKARKKYSFIHRVYDIRILKSYINVRT